MCSLYLVIDRSFRRDTSFARVAYLQIVYRFGDFAGVFPVMLIRNVKGRAMRMESRYVSRFAQVWTLLYMAVDIWARFPRKTYMEPRHAIYMVFNDEILKGK